MHRAFNRLANKWIRKLGRRPLWDTELTKLGRELFGEKYTGTFRGNHKPTSRPVKQYFIVNTAVKGSGEHWVSVYKNGDNMYIYDSYGRHSHKLLPAFIRANRGGGIRFIDSDRDPEQAADEVICGHLCIAWLQCVEKYGIRNALKI